MGSPPTPRNSISIESAWSRDISNLSVFICCHVAAQFMRWIRIAKPGSVIVPLSIRIGS